MRISQKLLFVALASTAAVLGVAISTASQLAKAGERPPPAAAVSAALVSGDGAVLHYQTEQYLNYDFRLADSLSPEEKAAQAKTITEKWIETDGSGEIVRFRSTTRLPDGVMWQDQLYEDGSEVVNFSGWSDRGLACSQTVALGPAGNAFTVVSADSLVAQGYSAAERPAEVAATRAGGIGRAFIKQQAAAGTPFDHRLRVVVMEPTSGQLLGEFIYGVQASGSQVLLESRVSTVSAAEPAPAGAFSMAPLPPCAHPSRQG